MNVELMLLTVLQGLRTQILDAGMLFFTHLGDAGFIWAALTAVLLVFRRTRRVGCVLAAALLIDAVLCNLLLKLCILCFQLLSFQTGQSSQTHIYDCLGLRIT